MPPRSRRLSAPNTRKNPLWTNAPLSTAGSTQVTEKAEVELPGSSTSAFVVERHVRRQLPRTQVRGMRPACTLWQICTPSPTPFSTASAFIVIQPITSRPLV